MNNFVYRKINSNDLEDFIKLRIVFLKEANIKAYKNEEELKINIQKYFTKALKNDGFVGWVCLYEDEIIATSGVSFYESLPAYNNPNGRIAYIMNMYTKKPYRKMGIAKTLFSKILQEGKNRNVGKFTLHATSNGEYLYKKYGFIKNTDEMILLED